MSLELLHRLAESSLEPYYTVVENESETDDLDSTIELEDFVLDYDTTEALFNEQNLKSFGISPEFQNSLNHLKLDYNTIELEFSNFVHCRNLVSLSLRRNKLTDVKPLFKISTLKVLILSGNNIGDEQIEDIKSIGSIEELRLSNNKIDKSITHLIDLCRNVKILSLNDNPFIGNPKTFVQAILKLKNLEQLIVGSSRPIGHQWDKTISDYIKSNPSTIRLTLYGITDTNTIVQALESNTILRELYLLQSNSNDIEQIQTPNRFLVIFKIENLHIASVEERNHRLHRVHAHQLQDAIRISRLVKMVPELDAVKRAIIHSSLTLFPASDIEAVSSILMEPVLSDVILAEKFDHHRFKRRCIIENGSTL